MTDKTQDSGKVTRRKFTKATAATFGAAMGFHFVPSKAWGNVEKPTLAGIGAGGKGRADINGSQKAGFVVRALVDVVDAKKLSGKPDRRSKSISDVRNTYSSAEFYADYREMLEKAGDKIDAVTVSTPDHHHFHATAMAMKAGKHVYTQKPLTHGIWEARMLRKLAKESPHIKTQMGNQAHANDHMRRCVELIRSGVIGKVTEVHAWTNRPIWPQGFAVPPAKEPIPESMDWEQWIGPASFVDYSSKIAPFAWRGWWNFGTGALGDMACHIMDMPYWALMPGVPKSVVAEQNGATDLSPPINSKLTWEFGPSKYTADEGFKYHWYDGFVNASFDRETWSLKKKDNAYNHPDEETLEGMSFRQFGSVIVGESGKLFFNRGRGKKWVLKTHDSIDGFEWPEETIPRAAREDNYQEWMDAVTGKIAQGESNFDLAAQLTETILLGVIAQRVPETKLNWNAEAMKFDGRPELSKFVKRAYRPGWEIEV